MATAFRNSSLDIAKGISILIVVWFHCHERWGMGLAASSVNFTDQMISFFFMPIFFIMAGMTIDTRKPLNSILRKSIDRLAIPYVIFSIISIAYCLLIKARQPDFPVFQRLHVSFPFITAWFLMTLTWARLLFVTIVKSIRKRHLMILSVLLISILGYNIGEQRIMFRADTALTVQVYLLAGYLMSKQISVSKQSAITGIFMLTACIISLALLSMKFNEEIAYVVNVYKVPYLILLTGAFLGSYSIFALSRLIGKNKPLEFYGRNSLIIMLTHPFYLYLLPYSLRMKCAECFGQLTYVYVFILIAILEFPTILFCNRYLPFLFGRANVLTKK